MSFLLLFKYSISLFAFLFTLFVVSVSDIYAANGALGSTGEVVFVEDNNGIVGWAKGPNSEKIQVDFYLTTRGGNISTSLVCTGGGISANQTVQNSFEGYDKIKDKNGYIFIFTDSCIKTIPDGDYDLYLALGPNLFANKLFQ